MDNKNFAVINKLMRINRMHKQRIDAAVADIGIHRTPHRILMFLARNGSLPSQKKLAECFEITPAAISGALGGLEADGYIKRHIGEDSRFNEVDITDSGREIVERTRVKFSAVDDALFAGFSEDEISSLSLYLERIVDNLKGETVNEKMV